MPIKFIFNFDLIGIAFTAVTSIILGFSILIRNRHNKTHLFFFLFSLVNGLWVIINYISYQITDPLYALWTIRLVLTTAVWHSALFFLFVYNFPEFTLKLKRDYFFAFLALITLISIFVLSPLVFPEVKIVEGLVPQPVVAPGILIFGLTTLTLVTLGIAQLVKKIKQANDKERLALEMILIGFLITFFSIIVLNFLLPALFSETIFISLSGIVTLPFIIMTAYAFMKYEFLDVKIISTEILVTLLTTSILLELALSKSLGEIILRGFVFVILLVFSVLLIRSVHSEVKQRKELGVANDKLKTLDQLKSQFLSFASHQLREPLSAIRILSKLLIQDFYGAVPTPVKEKIVQIERTAEGLIRLSDDFLNLRRIEEGRMEYQFTKVELVILLKSIISGFEPLILGRRLTIDLQTIPEKLTIWADEEKFGQVITNLIDNAVKYTKEGEIKINVTENKEDKTATISIHDSGIGINPETISTLFEQFKRDKNVRTIKGTGLGLYIAKQIVSDHKGRIWVESEGEGKGSTFFVTIPTS